MSATRRFFAFASLLVIAGALFILTGPLLTKVPLHGGKTLLEWADELRTLGGKLENTEEHVAELDAAKAAIRAIGTNALPFAWAEVSATTTWRERALYWLSVKVPFLKIKAPSVEARWIRGITMLQALGPIGKPLLPRLTPLASNQTGYAESALLAVGPDAIPAFTNLLKTSRYPKTGNLVGAFANAVYSRRISPEQGAVALPSLAEVWRSTDHHGRWYVASALGAVHQDAELCVPLLIEGMADPMPNIREASIRSLGMFGDAASPHAGKLAEAYDLADWMTRSAICSALAGFSSAHEISVPVLARASSDTNEIVALNAVQSLGQMKSLPEISIPALRKAATDQRRIVRMLAVQSLGLFRSEAVNEIPVLEDARNDPDPGVRNAATNALRWILLR